MYAVVCVTYNKGNKFGGVGGWWVLGRDRSELRKTKLSCPKALSLSHGDLWFLSQGKSGTGVGSAQRPSPTRRV